MKVLYRSLRLTVSMLCEFQSLDNMHCNVAFSWEVITGVGTRRYDLWVLFRVHKISLALLGALVTQGRGALAVPWVVVHVWDRRVVQGCVSGGQSSSQLLPGIGGVREVRWTVSARRTHQWWVGLPQHWQSS